MSVGNLKYYLGFNTITYWVSEIRDQSSVFRLFFKMCLKSEPWGSDFRHLSEMSKIWIHKNLDFRQVRMSDIYCIKICASLYCPKYYICVDILLVHINNIDLIDDITHSLYVLGLYHWSCRNWHLSSNFDKEKYNAYRFLKQLVTNSPLDMW